MLEISEMTADDLKEVAALEKKIFSQPWSVEGFAGSLGRKNTCYLTARVDGILAGYCGFFQVLDEADITNVAVAEEFRGRQIGYRMLCQLLKKAKKQGIADITLEVRRSNHPARNLYRKLGFREEGVRKNFYEKPTEDAVIMWKR